jgi:hypothetical protein
MNTRIDSVDVGRVLDEAYRCIQLVRLHVSYEQSGRTDEELRVTQNAFLAFSRSLAASAIYPYGRTDT